MTRAALVPGRLPRAFRNGAVPVGRMVARTGLAVPDTLTGVAHERRLVGSWVTTPAVVVVAAAVIVFAGTGGAFLQTVFGLGAAYLVAALGYNVVLGYAGQFAFCQNALMAIGAYVFAVAAPVWGTVPAFLIALAAATVTGALLGVAVLRTRGIYLALITLAFSQAVLLGVDLWPPTQGDNGIAVALAGDNAYLVAVVLAAACLLLVQRLIRSPLGRAFFLIRSDEQAAAAMGVNVPVTRMAAFAISGLLGGAGGILLAGVLTFVTPTNFTIGLTLMLLTMIVIGGVGSVWGTVVGVALMVAVQQYIPSLGNVGGYLDAAVLFVILALRPGGLSSLVDVRAGGALR